MAGKQAGNSIQGPSSPGEPERQAETPPQGLRVPRGRTLLGMPTPGAPSSPPAVSTSGRARKVVEEPLLPERKVEYAPPRPLVAAQKAGLEDSEPTTIEVAESARAASPTREPSLETEIPTEEERASAATLDTLPPRARHSSPIRARAIVIAVVVGAAAVTGFAAIRLAAVKRENAEAPRSEERTRAAALVPPVSSASLPEPQRDIVPAEGLPPEPRAAEPEKVAEIASAEPEVPPRPSTRQLATSSRRPKTLAPASNAEPTESPRTSPPRRPAGGAIVRESPF